MLPWGVGKGGAALLTINDLLLVVRLAHAQLLCLLLAKLRLRLKTCRLWLEGRIVLLYCLDAVLLRGHAILLWEASTISSG